MADAQKEKEKQFKQPRSRKEIEDDVKDFFLNEWLHGDYFRNKVDVEDPYCTLDEDLTFDELGRVDLFEYIENLYNISVPNKFVWKVQRLQQIYDFLERVIIKEGGKSVKRKAKKESEAEGKEKEKKTPFLVTDLASPSPSSFYRGAKIAFLFPGQGSQKVGMCKDLPPEGKKLFDRAKAILGYDLLRYCLEGILVVHPSTLTQTHDTIASKQGRVPFAQQYFSLARSRSLSRYHILGPDSKLSSTEISQPAIFVASLAALEKFKLENPDHILNW